MKNIIFFYILTLTILLTIGCSEERKEVEDKTYKLTIIVFDKIGDSEKSSLPREIIDLCKPINADICIDFVFTADTKIKKVNSNTELSFYYKFVPKGNAAKTFNQINTWTTFYLDDTVKIGKEFSIYNIVKNEDSLIRLLPEKYSSSNTFYYTSETDTIFKEFPKFTSIADLRDEIGNQLCNKTNSSFVIIYEPPKIEQEKQVEPEKEEPIKTKPIVLKKSNSKPTTSNNTQNLQIIDDKTVELKKQLAYYKDKIKELSDENLEIKKKALKIAYDLQLQIDILAQQKKNLAEEIEQGIINPTEAANRINKMGSGINNIQVGIESVGGMLPSEPEIITVTDTVKITETVSVENTEKIAKSYYDAAENAFRNAENSKDGFLNIRKDGGKTDGYKTALDGYKKAKDEGIEKYINVDINAKIEKVQKILNTRK